MKPQTAKQQLANAIRRMKAKGESESQKKLLKDVKAHIRNKFKESVDYQIIKQGKSRAAPPNPTPQTPPRPGEEGGGAQPPGGGPTPPRRTKCTPPQTTPYTTTN